MEGQVEAPYGRAFPFPPLVLPPSLSGARAQDIVQDKIAPYANKAIVEYLGAEEPELLNVVTEYLRDRKTPQELLDELEPVRSSQLPPLKRG